MSRHSWILGTAAISLALSSPSLGAGPASASEASPSSSGGQACLVLPNGDLECFASTSAMRYRSSQLLAAGSISCPVTLYSGANYTGRALELTGQGYWLNLSDYGFDNTTVSFQGTGCGFHLAQGQYGDGYWYPGYTGPWTASADMGSGWDDVVSSAYIN